MLRLPEIRIGISQLQDQGPISIKKAGFIERLNAQFVQYHFAHFIKCLPGISGDMRRY